MSLPPQLCIALITFIMPFAGAAQLRFTTNNNAITITGYTGTDKNIAIPSNINGYPVTSIGDFAFAACYSLTNIFVPSSVTNLSNDSAFIACTNLIAIDVDPDNPVYSSSGGVLFDKNQTTIVTYPGGLSNYIIPNTVTSIGDYAFANCPNITNVIIPSGVTNIGQYAFIGDGNVTNFTIPGTVTTFGQYAFAGATVTKFLIPNGVVNIGREAFGSTGISSIFIPASVTNIAPAAFDGYYLTSITVDSNNPAYSSVDGVLYDIDQHTLVEFPAARSGTLIHRGSYTVPQGTSVIGDAAFQNAYLLNITIPSSVTHIGDGAFDGSAVRTLFVPASVAYFGWLGYCPGLISIYFYGNAPMSGTGTPVWHPGNQPITAHYLAGTTGWGSYFQYPQIPTVPWTPPQIKPIGPENNPFGSNYSLGMEINFPADITVIIEACNDLSNPTWQPLLTNTIGAGQMVFVDPDQTNYPSRFYRLRLP